MRKQSGKPPAADPSRYWRRGLQSVFVLAIVLSLALTVVFYIQYKLYQEETTADAFATTREAEHQAAEAIDGMLAEVKPVADELAEDLARRRLSSHQLENHLPHILQKHGDLVGLGVAYEPFASDRPPLPKTDDTLEESPGSAEGAEVDATTAEKPLPRLFATST